VKEPNEETAKVIPPAVTSIDTPEGGQVTGSLDPRIRIIAQAIGRHIAREQIRAWEAEAGGQHRNTGKSESLKLSRMRRPEKERRGNVR